MEAMFLTTLFSVVFTMLFLLILLSLRRNEDSGADQDALFSLREGAIAKPESESYDLIARWFIVAIPRNLCHLVSAYLDFSVFSLSHPI